MRERAPTLTPTRKDDLMSPLISSDEARSARGWLSAIQTERLLLQRARDAARLELRGSNYSAEDRADVAAEILAAALADLPAGELPSPTDTRQSLTVYCGRARNYRKAIDRQRERDALQGEHDADAHALSTDALAPDADSGPDMNAQTPTDARLATVRACARLGYGDHCPADVWTLIYTTVRKLGAPKLAASVLSAELDGTPTPSIHRRQSEARARLARDFGDDAARFLAKLAGVEPTAHADALYWSKVDLSRPAVGHAETWTGRALRNAAADWRTGTNGGHWPDRPCGETREQRAAEARRVCKLSRTRKRTPKLGTVDKQTTADALARIGRALAQEGR